VDTRGAVALVVAIVVAAGFGLIWRTRSGRVRAGRVGSGRVRSGRVGSGGASAPAGLLLASLDAAPADGVEVTLLQLSSAFCAPCRTTRVVLGRIAETTPGVRHVEVDAEQHLDAVRALHVLRTPTVLVLDREGREVGRAVGLADEAAVRAAVAPLLSARNERGVSKSGTSES